MPRPTINALSQSELISELKRWIDAARHALEPTENTAAVRKVLTLVEGNPTSSLRPHVLHNLGCGRRAWLRQLATTLPPSLVADLVHQMGCEERSRGRIADYAVG